MQRSIPFALDYIFYLKKKTQNILKYTFLNLFYSTEWRTVILPQKYFLHFKLKNVVKPTLNYDISSVDFLVHETILFLSFIQFFMVGVISITIFSC